jgi:hypothetical protein
MMDFIGIRTNNLFFADNGNIHSNNAQTVQEILDLAYEWESDFGMKFSPSKCLVLSRQKNLAFNIGEKEIRNVISR